MNKNAENLMCEYSENVVAYLYAELPVREASIFEAHLEHCTACTDEFAAIADARYSVYEWHKEAFVPLATPRFVLPAEPVRASILTQIAGMLTGARPTLALAGGMALIVLAAFVGFRMLGPAEPQAVANLDVPVPEPVVKAAVPDVPSNLVPVEMPEVRPEPVKATAVRERRPVRRPAIEDKRKFERTVETLPANPLRQARRAPVLSNDIEVDDESLRLTDLFDEVGG